MEKGESFCLCFIDLNGLKSVNDHLGHPLGDQYLTTVVETLRTHFQENGDRLFRYGGDEFILLRYGTTPGDVKAQMAEVQEKLTQKSSSSENSFSMSISYGIVESADYDDADQMIREADQRMYEHKKKLRKV